MIVSLSACQARSAKREEGGYIFLVVFAVCGAILPFLPRKKPQRDPFSLEIRRKKIPTDLKDKGKPWIVFMCSVVSTPRVPKGLG